MDHFGITLGVFWVYEGGFGSLLGHFGFTLGMAAGGFVNLNENPRRFYGSKGGPGTKSRGARRHQGGTKEAPRRHRGDNAILDGPPYVVTTLLPTKNEVSEDLTRRLARGPANFR